MENLAFGRGSNADIVTMQKRPDRDLVILNLTDLHLSAGETDGGRGRFIRKTVDILVDRVRPDLLTLSGDNAWDSRDYTELVRLMDGYAIPWAAVMGNHDGEGKGDERECSEKLLGAKYSVYRPGPGEMGFGNYIIGIEENGKLLHTLFMMDTHGDVAEDGVNGWKGKGYDHLWPAQFGWYLDNLDLIERQHGRVESACIFHIPLREYGNAWSAATGIAEWNRQSGDAPFTGGSAGTAFGVFREAGCWPKKNNGFFDLMRKRGSTKNVICGHDHVNDCSVPYEGIRLTYALKTGCGCYWDRTLNGGTVLSVDGSGHMSVRHESVDSNAVCAQLGIDINDI